MADVLAEIRRHMREARTLDEMIAWWERGIDLIRRDSEVRQGKIAP